MWYRGGEGTEALLWSRVGGECGMGEERAQGFWYGGSERNGERLGQLV